MNQLSCHSDDNQEEPRWPLRAGSLGGRLGGRGLGSGNHSVMQTASEIPQRFVVVSRADRYVE